MCLSAGKSWLYICIFSNNNDNERCLNDYSSQSDCEVVTVCHSFHWSCRLHEEKRQRCREAERGLCGGNARFAAARPVSSVDHGTGREPAKATDVGGGG